MYMISRESLIKLMLLIACIFSTYTTTQAIDHGQQEYERQQQEYEREEFERQQREQEEFERQQREQEQQQEYEREEFERQQREQEEVHEFERQQQEQMQQQHEFQRQQQEQMEFERQHNNQHQLVVVPETSASTSGWRRENLKAASIRSMIESNHSSLAASTSPEGQKYKRSSHIRTKRIQNSLDIANAAAAAAEAALDDEAKAAVAAGLAANEYDQNAFDEEIAAIQDEFESAFRDL